MVGLLVGRERDQLDARVVAEALGVEGTGGDAVGDAVGERGQLGPTEGREQVAEPVVEPDLGVLVVGGGLAGLRRQVAVTGGQLGVVDGEGAPAGRRDQLVAVEAEHADVGQRPGRAAPEAAPDRLGRVLDDEDAELAAGGDEDVVVRALAVEVDGHDRFRQRPGPLASAQLVEDEVDVEAPRGRVGVDEDGVGAGVGDGVGGGGERERGDEHVVAGTDAGGVQGEVEGGGAAGQADGVAGAAHRGQLGLEGVEVRPDGRDPARVDGGQHRFPLAAAEVGRRQQDRRIGHVGDVVSVRCRAAPSRRRRARRTRPGRTRRR